MGSEHVDDIGRRAALAVAVRDLLLQSPHVVEVRLYGSLGAGSDHSDRYSDIDLVAVIDGLSDRAFATKLPDLLIPLGRPLIAGWGLDRLSRHLRPDPLPGELPALLAHRHRL